MRDPGETRDGKFWNANFRCFRRNPILGHSIGWLGWDDVMNRDPYICAIDDLLWLLWQADNIEEAKEEVLRARRFRGEGVRVPVEQDE